MGKKKRGGAAAVSTAAAAAASSSAVSSSPSAARGGKPTKQAAGKGEGEGQLRTVAFRLATGESIKYNSQPPYRLARDDNLVQLPLFPRSECQKLLFLTERFDDWDALSDSVDRKSENQHNIFDLAKGTNDGVLYPLCALISETVLQPVLQQTLGLTGLKLHWAFLRRYTVDGRTSFPVHRDSSAATVNILLSDPNDFSGAELYLLPNEFKNADKMSDKQFRKALPESDLRQKYSVPYRQGECCMHIGKRLHGVLPLTSGARFTLILMYLP